MKRAKKILQISTFNSNDTILQSCLEPLDLRNIDKNLKKDIELLKRAAAHHNLVSLAANQVQLQHRMFTILKQPLIVAGKWSGYEHKPDDYEVIANPQRIDQKGIRFKDFEQCPSLPGMKLAVWNPIHQSYSFYTPIDQNDGIVFQQSRITLQGFIARVWDHEVRHLDGLLALGQEISHGEIYVSDDYKQNPGVHQMVELTKKQLKFMSHQYLKSLFKTPQQGKTKGLPLSSDQLPDQLPKQMKRKFNNQYKSILDELERQQGSKDKDQ